MHYGTIGAAENLKHANLENELKTIIRAYSVRGLRVKVVQVNLKLKALKERNLFGVTINAVSRDEHVKNIERCHRVIKER